MNKIDMIPAIGIPTPTSIDLAYNQRSWKSYAAAVSQSGATPIAIDLELAGEALEATAALCDGFLLPGSIADVDPALYDTPRMDACGPADPAREQTDFSLIRHAQRTHKPVLGICYGCQSMNTFFGGSMIQDLSPLPVNHEAGAGVAIAHTVVVASASTLGAILAGDAEASAEALPTVQGDTPLASFRLPVNTSHHQAVARVGDGMRAAAHCPDDGVVEAIESDAAFHVEHPGTLLGVQWHPERSFDISAASRALFRHLTQQARAAKSSRKTV